MGISPMYFIDDPFDLNLILHIEESGDRMMRERNCWNDSQAGDNKGNES
jgi:hypothetical protein